MRKFRLILISLFCFSSVCNINIQSSLSKPYKDRKVTSNKPKILPKIIINSNTSKASENPLSKIAADHPDIAQAIIMAKKYKGTQPIEKSQLETQSQYEARFTASQPTNLNPIEIIVPAKETYKYDADEGNFIISIKTDYIYNENGYGSFKTGLVSQGRESSNITCTNGFGAKFYYQNIHYNSDRYSINYLKKELFSNREDSSWADFSWATSGSRLKSVSKTPPPKPTLVSQAPPPPTQQPLVPNPRITIDGVVNPAPNNPIQKLSDKYSNYAYGSFDFKLPMSVSDVRKYVTSDEKQLNGKLKFLVTIKPIFPFYRESTYYSGERCGNKYNTGGSTFTSSGMEYHALFDIVSLKLIDSSNNKILLERKYSQ